MTLIRRCVFFFGMISSTLAGATDNNYYRCEIRSYYHLSENGEILEHQHSAAMRGNTFSVDRASGVIDGSTTNIGLNTRPKVILSGDDNYPYVATTIDQQGRYVYQLNVANWSEGESKPFVFYRGSDMMSGLCTLSDVK